MPYDRDSFLAGIAVGRNMQSWPEMHGFGKNVFAFTIITTSSRLTYWFTIYSFAGTVYWGDGTEEEATTNPLSAPLKHTYTTPGIYHIRLTGNICEPKFNTSYASMLLSVDTPFPVPVYADGSAASFVAPYDTFSGCTSLVYIPENLFTNYKNIEVVNLSQLFRDCRSMTAIPAKLFDDLLFSTSGVNATGLFRGCRSVVEFPPEIFSNPGFETVNSVESLFNGCSSLVKLPVDKLPFKTASNFSGLCSGCSSLEVIPDGLFDDCIRASNMSGIFQNCHLITEIPDGLFDNCPDITTVANSFLYTQITSIPDGLFAGKSSLTSVAGAFRDTGILSIPGDLFDGCTALTTAVQTFYVCRSLVTVGQGLFNQSPNMNNFSFCFADCSSITSDVPELWEMFPNAQQHSLCFSNCTNAANYADIPSDWR